jgi:transposase-like protein
MKAMAKHRTYSIEFKRQVAQEYLAGETFHGLSRRHDISRNLIRIWVAKFEAGAFDEEARAADLLQEYEAKIAALERMVGRQALEIEPLKGGSEKRTTAEKRADIRDCRPRGLSIVEGCRLMGLPRSTYYDVPLVTVDEAEIVARHCRSYEREDLIFDPLHYLALPEWKIGALDQAAPLQGWDLPEAFASLRRLLEARLGKAGKREYVQVLRLLETFELEQVHGAVRDGLRLGAIGGACPRARQRRDPGDAVKHLVLCHIERRPARLDLDLYPYLPRARLADRTRKPQADNLSGKLIDDMRSNESRHHRFALTLDDGL